MVGSWSERDRIQLAKLYNSLASIHRKTKRLQEQFDSLHWPDEISQPVLNVMISAATAMRTVDIARGRK